MAGLADTANLGYGIGLGADYKEKTNLVNQIEQNRLKRAALEEQKQNKSKPDFSKQIDIDTTKYHSYLQPRIKNMYVDLANKWWDAKENGASQQTLWNIKNEAKNKIDAYTTANNSLLEIEKLATNADWLQKNPQTNDDIEFLNHIRTTSIDDDLKSKNPIFETTLGSFKIDANNGSIITNPIPKDDEQTFINYASDVAKKQNLGLYKDKNTGSIFIETGAPKTALEARQLEIEAGVPSGTYYSVEEMQQDFLAQSPKQILALKDKNKNALINLKEQLIQTQQIPQTVSDKEFLNDPNFNGIINNYLLEQQTKKINSAAIDISQKPFKTSDYLKNIANDITQVKTADIYGNQIISERKINQQEAVDNFNNLLNTSEMKQAIYDLGTDENGKNFNRQKGIDKAFEIYKNDLIKNQKSLSMFNEFKPLSGGGGGTLWSGNKQFTIQPIDASNTYISADELDAIKFAMEGKNERGENLLTYIDSKTKKPYFSVSPKNPEDKQSLETPNIPKTIYEGWGVLKEFGHKERAAPKNSYMISAASIAKDEKTKLSDFNLKAANGKEYASHITGFVADKNGNITHVAAIPAGQDISQGAKEILFPYQKNVDAVAGYTSGGGNLEEVVKKLYQGNNNIIGNKKDQIKVSNVPKVQKKENGGLIQERMFILGNKAYKESKLKDAGYDINILEEYK